MLLRDQIVVEKLPELDTLLTASEARINKRIEEATFMEGGLIKAHWTNPKSWNQEDLVSANYCIRNESERFSIKGDILTHFGRKFSNLYELASNSIYKVSLLIF